jgi:hypothetical protein
LFPKLKKQFSPPPCASNIGKNAQFSKGMGKLWVLSLRGLMGELKDIRILSLKFFIIASLTLNYKKSCKALVGTTIRFLITQKGLKMKKI